VKRLRKKMERAAGPSKKLKFLSEAVDTTLDVIPITTKGIERILAKVTDVASDINKNLLQVELQRCALTYSVRRGGGGIRLTEQTLRRLRKLQVLLRELRKDRQTPWHLLGEEVSNLLKSDKVVARVDTVLAYRHPTPPLAANPKEILVGQDLPFVFRRFFGRYPSISDNRIFVQAVLCEMGIHYSDNSIDRAFADEGRRRPERNANKERKQRRSARAAVRASFSKTASS
jgi:hypothetical protein